VVLLQGCGPVSSSIDLRLVPTLTGIMLGAASDHDDSDGFGVATVLVLPYGNRHCKYHALSQNA